MTTSESVSASRRPKSRLGQQELNTHTGGSASLRPPPPRPAPPGGLQGTQDTRAGREGDAREETTQGAGQHPSHGAVSPQSGAAEVKSVRLFLGSPCQDSSLPESSSSSPKQLSASASGSPSS